MGSVLASHLLCLEDSVFVTHPELAESFGVPEVHYINVYLLHTWEEVLTNVGISNLIANSH